MKRLGIALALMLIVSMPVPCFALGLEIAVGGWEQSPSGSVAYKDASVSDEIDIENDAKYDDETQVYGRAKIDLPAILPNIYLMATPMEFEGTGQKNVNFKFGDQVFSANVDFYSKIVLDHYDIGFYYGLPFIETATAKKFNVEVGLNVKVIDFSVEVRQDATGISESYSQTIPMPMIYAGAQLRPVKWLAIEAEARGVAYSGNHYYDYIGRLKVKPIGPLFLAAGWRSHDIQIDEDDVNAEIEFSGPFAEVGVEF